MLGWWQGMSSLGWRLQVWRAAPKNGTVLSELSSRRATGSAALCPCSPTSKALPQATLLSAVFWQMSITLNLMTDRENCGALYASMQPTKRDDGACAERAGQDALQQVLPRSFLSLSVSTSRNLDRFALSRNRACALTESFSQNLDVC